MEPFVSSSLPLSRNNLELQVSDDQSHLTSAKLLSLTRLWWVCEASRSPFCLPSPHSFPSLSPSPWFPLPFLLPIPWFTLLPLLYFLSSYPLSYPPPPFLLSLLLPSFLLSLFYSPLSFSLSLLLLTSRNFFVCLSVSLLPSFLPSLVLSDLQKILY